MFGPSILDILEDYIQKWANEKFADDDCPPKYVVSLYDSDINNQYIVVTVTHMGRSFTENIFPRKGTDYGYDSLENLLMSLYNRTM